MPQWKGCNNSQKTLIETAFQESIAENSSLAIFPDLRDSLEAKWDKIKIECRQKPNLEGEQFGYKISIYTTNPDRVGLVFLHELVHVCDGFELDSEAIERIFNEQNATLPTDKDFRKFFLETTTFKGNKKERVGKYVIWNCETGKVWVKVQTGGGWFGGQISKGDRCFQSDAWKSDYSYISIFSLPYRIFLKLYRGFAKLIT